MAPQRVCDPLPISLELQNVHVRSLRRRIDQLEEENALLRSLVTSGKAPPAEPAVSLPPQATEQR